jgi:hypothetical protein
VEEGACGHIVIPPLLLLDRYIQTCIALLRVSYSHNNIITYQLRRELYSKSNGVPQLSLSADHRQNKGLEWVDKARPRTWSEEPRLGA